MGNNREKFDAVTSSFRHVDNDTDTQTDDVKPPPHVLIQQGATSGDDEEELESLLEQARVIAKAQGRELTEVEASFIGVGSALNSMLNLVQQVQEQVLTMAARHVALEKRFNALEKKLKGR